MYVLIGIPLTYFSHEILIKVDEEIHNTSCKAANAKYDADSVLIQCEVCEKDVEFTVFEKHMHQHKALLRQMEEEKSLYDLIPCDKCRTEIPFNKYEKHVKECKPSPVTNPEPTSVTNPEPTKPAGIKRSQSTPEVGLPKTEKISVSKVNTTTAEISGNLLRSGRI